MRIRRAAGVLALAWSFAATSLLSAAASAASPPVKPAGPQAGKSPPGEPKGAEKKPAAAKTDAPASAKEAPAAAKPPAKAYKPPAGKPAPAKAPAKKAASKKAPRKPGSEPGTPDEATRRVIAGTPPPPEQTVTESPELRAMRAIDMALFPQPGASDPWPTGDPLSIEGGGPRIHASGLPPTRELGPPDEDGAALDLTWLRGLAMPDIPVRWDARVVRYLDYYKNDPRGRATVAGWIKKSGRYGGQVRRALREQNIPEDVLWLSLVESGFNPTIQSPAGAAGLWQFMPEGARIYGLTVDRWVDERLDPERSTVAAARYLSDLRQRFGSWELAFAAYNMGYGGLLAAIRKYNTNDYWELSRFEAGTPYETSLYVPKIVALAIVSRNRAVFGCDGVELDPALTFDSVSVGSGVSVQAVASASGATLGAIAALNPQLIASRTPPLPPSASEDRSWVVRVPPGAGARAAKSIPSLAKDEGHLGRHVVRWGESLDAVAAAYGTTAPALQSLNGLRRGEVVRPGTVVFVPDAQTRAALPADEPVVVVPASVAPEPDMKRVFYRVVTGDTARDVASAFGVLPGDLARWNAIDAGAALHDGMTLQVYVPPAQPLDHVVALDEKDAVVLVAGSPEFFDYCEAQKGRKRLEIAAARGDTWRSLAKRYGLSIGSLERINQRPRNGELSPGERVVVYVPSRRGGAPKAAPLPSDPGVAVAVRKPDDEPAGKDDPGDVPAAADDASDAPPPQSAGEPGQAGMLAPSQGPTETREPGGSTSALEAAGRPGSAASSARQRAVK